MDISTITNFLKLPKKVIFLITLLSIIILFSPQSFMEKIDLYKFKEEYTMWIGIVFLFTLGLSIISIYEYFKEEYDINKLEKEYKKEFLKILTSLDQDELINIREFYIQKKNTIEMSYGNPTVSGLVNKSIIHFVSREGWGDSYIRGPVCFFKLSDDAKNYFDTFNFPKFNNIQRPSWCNDIANSKKMSQQIQNMKTNMLSRHF